jgi:hypothetical protein
MSPELERNPLSAKVIASDSESIQPCGPRNQAAADDACAT